MQSYVCGQRSVMVFWVGTGGGVSCGAWLGVASGLSGVKRVAVCAALGCWARRRGGSHGILRGRQ
eukprot:9223143-Ditylum_brightwellii.AAC.1